MSARTYESREFKRRNQDVKLRLEALHEALDLGRSWLTPETVSASEKWLAIARGRLEQSLDHTIVALAGPTGAGKSSLINAIAGAQVATASVKRPTTSQALAVVWDSTAEGRESAARLLDWLDIPGRHYRSEHDEPAEASAKRSLFRKGQSETHVHGSQVPTKQQRKPMESGLIVVDLPDFDSIVAEHRVRADHLTERADLLVWVTDPQKYADAVMHNEYLKKFSNHTNMVVVLNQVDRLTPAEREQCLSDIRRLLAKDGITGATTLAVSTKTGEGISELSSLLSIAAARRAAQSASLVADLKAAATRIADECGGKASGRLADSAVEELTHSLAHAAGVDAITDAVYQSSLRRSHIATGWPPTAWIAKFRKDPLRTLGLAEGWLSPRRTKNAAGAPLGAGTNSADLIRPATARSSMTRQDSGLEAKAKTAVRNFVASQTSTGPIDWQMGVRQEIGEVNLADQLDSAIANSPSIRLTRPTWWNVVGFVHKFLLVVLAVGLLWLGFLAGAAYLQLDVPASPSLVGFPVPTVLTFVGLVGGIVLGLLARILSLLHARRAARRTYDSLTGHVGEVADRFVISPVKAARAQLEGCLSAALIAAR